MPDRPPPRTVVYVSAAVVFMPLATWWQPVFAYSAVAVVLLDTAGLVRFIPNGVRVAADHSYEYYLVHGVALVGAVRLLPTSPVAAICVGIVAAAAAAVVLKWAAAGLEVVVVRAMASGTPEPDLQRGPA